MFRSPEVQFLATHPLAVAHGGPRLPVTLAYFRTLRGLPVHVRCRLTPEAWQGLQAHWPAYRAWAEAGGPVPPESWPPCLQAAWATALRGLRPPTPRQFAQDFTPLDKTTLYRSPLLRVFGVNELAASAVGFPLTPAELDRAVAALHKLATHRNFFIWAACLDLSTVPLPQKLAKRRGAGKKKSRTTLDLFARLDMRGLLETNPLAVGSDSLRWALPDAVGIAQLERCQQRPWTHRSTKPDYTLDALPPLG